MDIYIIIPFLFPVFNLNCRCIKHELGSFFQFSLKPKRSKAQFPPPVVRLEF